MSKKINNIVILGLVIAGGISSYSIYKNRVQVPSCDNPKVLSILKNSADGQSKNVSKMLSKKVKFFFSNIVQSSHSFGKNRECKADLTARVDDNRTIHYSTPSYSIEKDHLFDNTFHVHIHHFYGEGDN